MSKRARVLTWSDLEADHPMDRIDRRRVIGEHAMLSHLLLHAGFRVATHSHPNEQFAVVLSGRIRFTLHSEDGDEIVELGAGQVLHLPPEVPHGAEAIEDTVVLDVFSPASERTGVDQR